MAVPHSASSTLRTASVGKKATSAWCFTAAISHSITSRAPLRARGRLLRRHGRGRAVEALDQGIDALALEHRGELRAPRRELADGAGEIDVDDLPALAFLAHQVLDDHRRAVGANDPAVDQHVG